MTLVELQEVLGKQIEHLTDEREPYENKRRIAENALVISSLAKQMINNADVVLRSVKFVADYKLEDDTIKDMGWLTMKNEKPGVYKHTFGFEYCNMTDCPYYKPKIKGRKWAEKEDNNG